MKKLVPVLFLVVGLASGGAAGLYLNPAETMDDAGEEAVLKDGESNEKAEGQPSSAIKAKQPAEDESSASEYVKLSKQFVVPIVADDQISAMATVSLSLEVTEGGSDEVYLIEPKLRDVFLQVLFDHANMGGFDGAFTRPDNLAPLRKALNDVASLELGSVVKDVLIVDIARQDT